MSDMTVEPRPGGGWIVCYPGGDESVWPLSGEAFRLELESHRRQLAELEAIEAHIERQPEIPVGTAGTATVRGVKGVRVMRARRSSEDYPFWMSAEDVYGFPHHLIGDVKDFVPDELLTDETREQIKAEERERIYRVFIDKFAASDSIDARTYVRFANWLKAGAR